MNASKEVRTDTLDTQDTLDTLDTLDTPSSKAGQLTKCKE